MASDSVDSSTEQWARRQVLTLVTLIAIIVAVLLVRWLLSVLVGEPNPPVCKVVGEDAPRPTIPGSWMEPDGPYGLLWGGLKMVGLLAFAGACLVLTQAAADPADKRLYRSVGLMVGVGTIVYLLVPHVNRTFSEWPKRSRETAPMWSVSDEELGFSIALAGFSSDSQQVILTGPPMIDWPKTYGWKFGNDSQTILMFDSAGNGRFFKLPHLSPVGDEFKLPYGKDDWLLDFDRSGRLFLTYQSRKDCLIWNAVAKEIGPHVAVSLAPYFSNELDEMKGACLAPDGSWFMAWTQFGFGSWKTEKGQWYDAKERFAWVRCKSEVADVVPTPDGRWLLKTGKGGMQMWDAATGQIAGPPFGEVSGEYSHPQISADGRLVLVERVGAVPGIEKEDASRPGKMIELWDMVERTRQAAISQVSPKAHILAGAALSPDGTRLAVPQEIQVKELFATEASLIQLRDRAGALIAEIHPPLRTSGVLFTADGLLACYGERNHRSDGKRAIFLYNAINGLPVSAPRSIKAIDVPGVLRTSAPSLAGVRLSDRDKKLTAGNWTIALEPPDSRFAKLVVRDDSGTERNIFSMDNFDQLRIALAISPDGRFAIVYSQKRCSLWRLPD